MSKSTAIHWVGAGLASGPGIVSLAERGVSLTVWDMTPDRAQLLKEGLSSNADMDIRILDLGKEASVTAFKAAISPTDIIVSMLPAALHMQMAEIALEVKAHLVTSSYVSPEMAELDMRAREADVALVNEVGLDPGIDHLFAHLLVDAAKSSGVLGVGNAVEFVSYCGGVPAEETDFTYKFAWTPFGVLTALQNKARLIEDGAEKTVEKAWENISELDVFGETFEVYANRDSIPYVEEYGLSGESNIKTFVRGTLRLAGWKEAWKDIFTQVDGASLDELKILSDKLSAEHTYGEDEEDRVVLYVALSVLLKDGTEWTASLSLDEKGSGWKTAMASTVSLTVAQAVIALMKGTMAPGVHAAVEDVAGCRDWIAGLKQSGIAVKARNVNL